MSVIGNFFKNMLIERPYRDKTAEQLAVELTNSMNKVSQKWAAKPDSEKNRNLLRHIIGIEKWGQARLRVPLGEPLDPDEYNKFSPAKNSSWTELQEAFKQTRKESIELLYLLDHRNIPLETTVSHNGMGDVTIRGWMRYFVFHGNSGTATHGNLD